MIRTSSYTNIAFISYKREDEKWAKWLQKKLEHYKLPTEIRKQNPELEFAKNPRHVFKDTTDLSGGVLAKAIKEGLDSSKFLIVICSPRAAKSEWVCKEVQDFIDSGREEYIIPFIIDGEPYAKNPEDECFPEALKTLAGERELLGININENGRESAAVKVVSRVFDLRFDTLWNRFQREQKKRRQTIITGLVASILLIAGIASWIGWQYMELEKANDTIEHQYKELQTKNSQIQQQNKDLDAKSDSIQTANDSIQRAYEKLNMSEKKLAKSNDDLRETNKRLAIEIENVKKANWEMLTMRGRVVTEKAKKLISENEPLIAASLINEIMPSESNHTPYLPEFNSVLSSAIDSIKYSHWYPFAMKAHHGEIMCCEISKDEKMVVTGSNDKSVRIWELTNGKEREKCRMIHNTSIENVAISPNSKYVVTQTLYNDSLYLWNITNEYSCLVSCIGVGESPRFLNDSLMIFQHVRKHPEYDIYEQDGVGLYNIYTNHKDSIVGYHRVYYSNDTNYVVLIEENTDTTNDNKYEMTVLGKDGSGTFGVGDINMIDAKFSFDNHYFAIYENKGIDIIDLKTMEVTKNRIADKDCCDWTFSSDNEHIIYTDLNNSKENVYYWNIENGEIDKTVTFPTEIENICTSSKGGLLYGGGDNGIGYIWHPISQNTYMYSKNDKEFVKLNDSHGYIIDNGQIYDVSNSDTTLFCTIPTCVTEIFENKNNVMITTYDVNLPKGDSTSVLNTGGYITKVFNRNGDEIFYTTQHSVAISNLHNWIILTDGYIYDLDKDKTISKFYGHENNISCGCCTNFRLHRKS